MPRPPLLAPLALLAAAPFLLAACGGDDSSQDEDDITAAIEQAATTDDAAKRAPKKRAVGIVGANFRNANAEPRATMPRPARQKGMKSVSIVAANAAGKPVQRKTST